MQGKQEITALLVQPLRLEFGAVVSPTLSRLIQVEETLPWECADRNILPAPGHDNSLWHLQHLPFAVAMKAGILRWQFHSIELGIVFVLLLLCSPPIRSVPSSQRDLLKKHEIQSDLVTLLLNARQCTAPQTLVPRIPTDDLLWSKDPTCFPDLVSCFSSHMGSYFTVFSPGCPLCLARSFLLLLITIQLKCHPRGASPSLTVIAAKMPLTHILPALLNHPAYAFVALSTTESILRNSLFI